MIGPIKEPRRNNTRTPRTHTTAESRTTWLQLFVRERLRAIAPGGVVAGASINYLLCASRLRGGR